MCNELDPDYAESAICESLVIPTEIANTNTTSQSSQSAQGNLLQVYFKKFADLLGDPKLSKLCKDAGFLEKIEKGQFFITIEERSEIMQTACREYTHNLEILKDPDREGGLVQIRRSVHSWMPNSIHTKDVIALIS